VLATKVGRKPDRQGLSRANIRVAASTGAESRSTARAAAALAWVRSQPGVVAPV